MLAVLRRREFGLLWLGGLVAVAGDWMLYAALPYFVYARTGSTVATAGMIVAELAPGVVLGSVAGVFVDRWSRKRVLVVANVLQAVAVALLLLVPNGGWIGLVYVAALAESAVAAFFVPAESALLPSLVADADLVAANALNALNNRLGRLVGLPLGGALVGAVGLRGVVLADCATFVFAALLIAPIGAPARARAQRGAAESARSAYGAPWAEWLDGLRIVRCERTIAVIFVVLGVMTFGGTMLDPLFAPWVRDVLHQGAEVYAWLLAAHSASGILGTLLVGRFGARLSPRVLMGWSSVAAGIMLLVRSNVPSVSLAFALALAGGVTSVAAAVGAETLVQRSIRDEYRGRVFGLLGASGALFSLLGASVGGLCAEAVGIVPMLDVASALILFAGLVVLRAFAPSGRAVSRRRVRRHGERRAFPRRARRARESPLRPPR
jgi:predicted MFS family arabinose efflux permease